MGVFTEDPSSLLSRVAKSKQKQTFGGQYQPHQFVDYIDYITESGNSSQVVKVMDINQWRNQVETQGVSGIPDALSWNTYGVPNNPENQFFRKQYEKAQQIKWDVQNSYKRTPEEAEAQKNLFWLANKYDIRISPYKKDSDDTEIYDDSIRANFGKDTEGHYEAFRKLAEQYPEMAKKITNYQNYQSTANERKAQEYDRRFGTQYYKPKSLSKAKKFDLDSWTQMARESVLKTNPDGTIRVDRDLAKKFIREAHQMRLDNMDWFDSVMNRTGRFVGGLLDIVPKLVGTDTRTLDFGFDDEAYREGKVLKAENDLSLGDLTKDLLFNTAKIPSSLLGMVGIRSDNYDKEAKVNSAINDMSLLLDASKNGNTFDMSKAKDMNHGTFDFVNSIGTGFGVLSPAMGVGRLKGGLWGMAIGQTLAEVAPGLWSNVQEAIFGEEAYRYNQMANYMERIYPDHKSIDEYDKVTANIRDRGTRAEREALSKQMRYMRENVINDVKGDPGILGMDLSEAWARYGGMTADVINLGFAMNLGRNMWAKKGINPKTAPEGKFPAMNWSDNFYSHIYNRIYMKQDPRMMWQAAEKATGWLASAGTKFKATELSKVDGRLGKLLEVAKRVGNYSGREALDAIPTWAAAEMLLRDGNMSTKQLTDAMYTGIAYNVLGDWMGRTFASVGKRLPFAQNPVMQSKAMQKVFGGKFDGKLEEFKDHPLLKQFGDQYDIINYKAKILGDWFANPIQGMFSAYFMEDGDSVENVAKYFRNEAVGDLLTGLLLSGQMHYGNRNRRNNYLDIYNKIANDARNSETAENLYNATNDTHEANKPKPEPEPQQEQNASENNPEQDSSYYGDPDDMTNERIDISEEDLAKEFNNLNGVEADKETLINDEELAQKINDELLGEELEKKVAESEANPFIEEETDSVDAGVDENLNDEFIEPIISQKGDEDEAGADVPKDTNSQVIGEGEYIPNEDEFTMAQDDIESVDGIEKKKVTEQDNSQASSGIFSGKWAKGQSEAENPMKMGIFINGTDYEVVLKNGQHFYNDNGKLKPLPKGQKPYVRVDPDSEAFKVWVDDFVARTGEMWAKYAEAGADEANRFLVNAEVNLRSSIVKNYGLSPFLASLVDDMNMTSENIKSIIRVSSNIDKLAKQNKQNSDLGITENAHETQRLTLHHEMFHMIHNILRDDPEYNRLFEEAVEALKTMDSLDEVRDEGYYERAYRDIYQEQLAKLGKDVESPEVLAQIQRLLDEELIADMWSYFMLGNEKFGDERGAIGKFFQKWNHKLYEQQGTRGLLHLWKASKDLGLFEHLKSLEYQESAKAWIDKRKGINSQPDPIMSQLWGNTVTQKLMDLGMETKQIVSVLKDLDFNLRTTHDVVKKFNNEWSNFDDYLDFLTKKNEAQSFDNKLFKTEADKFNFATKSYIKMHPGSYEPNNSSSIFIFQSKGNGKIEMAIEPYNGYDKTTSALPADSYSNFQIGESHNVQADRLTKSGWNKAKRILSGALGRNQDRENNPEIYQVLMEGLISEQAIIRHPDNVGVMLPVRDRDYKFVLPVGQQGKEADYGRDLDGYSVEPKDRYTFTRSIDPATGEVVQKLTQNNNGELYFKQFYKFDSSIYNSDNAKEINRNLMMQGFYPMPGSHVAMQTLDIRHIFGQIFDKTFNEKPNYNNWGDTMKAIKRLKPIYDKLVDIEHTQLKDFLSSIYAQETYGYFGKNLVYLNELGKSVPLLSLVNIVPVDGKLTLQINPNAQIRVNADSVVLASKYLNGKEAEEALRPIMTQMEQALEGVTKFFSPLSTYNLFHDFNDKYNTMPDQNPDEFFDMYLSDALKDSEQDILDNYMDRFITGVNGNTALKDKNGLIQPPDLVASDLHDMVKNLMIDKFMAIIDQQMLTAIDASGKSFMLSSKYNNKYISSLTHEWQAPSLKQIAPALRLLRNDKAILSNQNQLMDTAPIGFSIGKDGELYLNTYIFDPEVWAKKYPELTDEVNRLLATLGKESIDGATIMLNNDPYTLRDGRMTIQEGLGIIGGVNPTGSYKNRLHIGNHYGTIELKHAMHPLTYDQTVRPDISPGREQLGQLVAVLRAGGVGAIVMKSALKGDATHTLQVKEIDGVKYGVGVFGDIRAAYNETRGAFESLKTTEGQEPIQIGVPTVPFQELFNLDSNGKFNMKADNTKIIEDRTFKIPLTGKDGLSWGDGQKGKPHSITGSAPFRMPSFSPASKYMIPKGQQANETMPFGNNASNAISNWVQNMGQNVMDLHNAFGDITDYVGNNQMQFSEQQLGNVFNLLKELRNYINQRVDRERDADNDNDEFMKQSLNYTTDTTDYKNVVRLLDNILDPILNKHDLELASALNGGNLVIPDFSMADVAPLIAMSDSIIENTFTSRRIHPIDSMTGINTVFWQMMKFKHKNLVNLKGKGTMSVFVPNTDNIGDLGRMMKQFKNKDEAKKFFVEANEMLDMETGLWKDGSHAISISADTMAKFKLKPGDKVFAVLVPPDSAMSIIPMRVMGILAEGNQNALAFNSKIALEYWGRDHDIDQVSLMVNDKNWMKDGADGFGFLWETIASHGFHEGKPKDNLVKAKAMLEQNKKFVGGTTKFRHKVRGKKEYIEYDVLNYNSLANDPRFNIDMGDGRISNIFDNKYETRGYPVLAPLDISAPHDSRAYFSNKKIGIAASLGNKMGSLMHKHNGLLKVGSEEPLSLPIADYMAIRKMLGDNVIENGVTSIKNLSFNIRHNDAIYDAHFPYMKEGTVDTYSQLPIKFQPYAWMATMMVDNVSYAINNSSGKTENDIVNVKFSELNDPVVRTFIAAQLHDIEKSSNSGQYAPDIFTDDEGYSYNSIRNRLHRITQGTSASEYSFRSSLSNVFDKDYGIKVADNVDISVRGAGTMSNRNFNSIDDIIDNVFKSLFFRNTEFGTNPVPSDSEEADNSRANFKRGNKGAGFNRGVADFKRRMIAHATSGLQTLAHFGLLHDKLLPNELFRAINPMPPMMANPGGEAMKPTIRYDNLSRSPKESLMGSEYFRNIDLISKVAYGWISAFDKDYAVINQIDSETGWAEPKIDNKKERELFHMQKMFRQLNNTNVGSPLSLIGNDLIGMSVLDTITSTVLDAEMNSNNRASMLFHRDESGRFLYTKGKPLPMVFALYEAGSSTSARWRTQLAYDIAGENRMVSAGLFVDDNGEPMITVKVDGIEKLTTHANELKNMNQFLNDAFRDFELTSKDREVQRIGIELVQSIVLGGQAYTGGTRINSQDRTIYANGSVCMLGAIPNQASHKQNFLRLLYSNMIEKMGDASTNNMKGKIRNVIPGVPANRENIRNLVAGMVMSHPLGGESFNQFFGVATNNAGNPLEYSNDTTKQPDTPFGKVLTELERAEQTVMGLYPDRATAFIQLKRATGSHNGGASNMIADVTKTPAGTSFSGKMVAHRKPGEILSYLDILEDMTKRYASIAQSKPEGLDAIKNTLSVLHDTRNAIIDIMIPEQKKGESRMKWTNMEELVSGDSFIFTPLGQKVMQELTNRGIDPKVIYHSETGRGDMHDIRDVAAHLITEYSKYSDNNYKGMLSQYSIFDDMVHPYEGLAKLRDKVPNWVKAFKMVDHIVAFGRKNSVVNNRFRKSLENFIKDKKFSDGTPITFSHLFDSHTMKENVNLPPDIVTRTYEVAEVVRQYFFNELADIYNIPPAERKQTYAEWSKETNTPNITKEDYFARLAYEQLKAISSTSAMVLNQALSKFDIDKDGRDNTVAFLNKHAENIAEMFHVLKDYKSAEKRRMKQMKASKMTIEEANNSVVHVIKTNLNITRRNSPETLAKLYSTQKVLSPTSIITMPTSEVDIDGNLIDGEDYSVPLSSDQLSPNLFGSGLKDKVVTSTAEIILAHADAIFNKVRNSQRFKNEAAEEYLRNMGKVTPEEEASYDDALRRITEVLPKFFASDFRVKFMKVGGNLVPKIMFKKGGVVNGTYVEGSHSGIGMRWADFQKIFIDEFKNRIHTDNQEGDKVNYEALHGSAIVDKALGNWLSMKLVAATQGVVAKQYIKILDALVYKLQPEGIESYSNNPNAYINQFANIREELQQIVDLALFSESSSIEMPDVKVVNPESFSFLPGSSINMTQMKLNATTRLSDLLSMAMSRDSEMLEKNADSIDQVLKIFGSSREKLSKARDPQEVLIKILNSALGYVNRQENIDNEDEQYTMHDRMMGTVKRVGLTSNNRITMELLAMSNVGGAYVGSVTPTSINNMNNLIDNSFNMAAYGLLGKIYDSMVNNMSNSLAHMYGLDVRGHVEENPIVSTEVFNQLAEMRGESVAYSQRLAPNKQGNFATEIGDTLSIDYLRTNANSKKINKNAKGFMVQQDKDSILMWIPSKNTFELIKKADMIGVTKGLSYDDEYSAYLDTVRGVMKTNLNPAKVQEIIERHKARDEKAHRKVKEYDVANAMDNWLNEASDALVDDIYQSDIPFKARMSRIRKYGIAAEALGGYQGGMKLIGTVTAGATALGAFAIGSPIAGTALGGYALTQGWGYITKQIGAVSQNYGSALLREMLPINGLFKTIKTALNQTVKENRSDTQASIANSISTFIKDEVAQKQMVSDLDRKQVDQLINTLKRANNSIETNDALLLELDKLSSGNTSQKMVRQVAQKTLEEQVAPDNDYVAFWLKHIDFDPATKQYLLKNGHEINSLMKLKHDLIKDRLTNLLTFGQLIASSEESSKKLGSKVFAQYLDEEQIVKGASSNEISTIIDRFMDRSAGNYKANQRLSKNKHGFNQLLTLYERFNRDNNAYYLRDVYNSIDKSLSIDWLAEQFGGYGKSGRGTYATVKGINTAIPDDIKFNVAYNIDELASYKKKLVLATSMAVTNMLAKAGMLLLAGFTMNEELAKKMKTALDGLDVVTDVERYTSLGGLMQASTHAALLAGSAMLIDHNKMLTGTANKSELKKLIKEEIRNSGSILQNAGIGLGYSKIFELPMALGNQFMLHNMRTLSPKIHKMLDDETHEYWINYSTGMTKLFGVLSLAEKVGSVATTTVGLAQGNDAYKSDVAHTITLTSDERKKEKKKKITKSETDSNGL